MTRPTSDLRRVDPSSREQGNPGVLQIVRAKRREGRRQSNHLYAASRARNASAAVGGYPPNPPPSGSPPSSLAGSLAILAGWVLSPSVLAGWISVRLAYGFSRCPSYPEDLLVSGPGRDRTCDPGIMSPLL